MVYAINKEKLKLAKAWRKLKKTESDVMIHSRFTKYDSDSPRLDEKHQDDSRVHCTYNARTRIVVLPDWHNDDEGGDRETFDAPVLAGASSGPILDNPVIRSPGLEAPGMIDDR